MTSEQRLLFLVEPHVFLFYSLVFDIRCHSTFTSVFSDGRDIVAIGPEFSTPELFLHFRDSGKDLSRDDTFHGSSDLGRSIGGNRLDEKVNMLFVCAYFKKVDLVTIGDILAYLFHDHVHFLGQHNSPVFGRTDEMIDENTDIVSFVDIYAHDL